MNAGCGEPEFETDVTTNHLCGEQGGTPKGVKQICG
jgi:hypothetical protein